MPCRRKQFKTRKTATNEHAYAYWCRQCRAYHRDKKVTAETRYAPRKQPAQELTYEQRRARMFGDFEASITAQMARINERMARFDDRVRQVNKGSRDNGPLIVEGGSVLAYQGDDADVEHRK